MASERVKSSTGTEKDKNTDCGQVGVDRISKLPNDVIYHILSFVPTVDVVRMSRLSKRWRRMWHTVPTLQFEDNCFGRAEAFNKFVDKCLKNRRRAMRFIDGPVVTSFKLEISCSNKLFGGLSKWFGSDFIMNNVKEFNLSFWSLYFEPEPCTVPSAVLNGRSLTHLKLNGFLEISASCSLNLPFLESLHLERIRIDGETPRDLLAGCPSLEKCVLYCIEYDGELRISSFSLKFLQIEYEYYCGCGWKGESEGETVDIICRNLESLVFRTCCNVRADFSSCRAIRDLELRYICKFEDKTFEDQISQLPVLENLAVYTWEGSANLNISSESLKHFYLYKEYREELEVAINTPNLVSFKYKGDMKLSMSMTRSYGRVAGQFSINDVDGSSELINFLSNINCAWNSVDLCVDNDNKDFVLPKNLKEISLPPWLYLKHMKVKISGKWTRKSEFRDFLERLAQSLEALAIE